MQRLLRHPEDRVLDVGGDRARRASHPASARPGAPGAASRRACAARPRARPRTARAGAARPAPRAALRSPRGPAAAPEPAPSAARSASVVINAAAASAVSRRLKSFCDTASWRSRASRVRSSTSASSRLRSFSRALASATAAWPASSTSSASSSSVKPLLVGGVGEVDRADHDVVVDDRHAEEVGQDRMRGRPPAEPRVRPDVRDPLRPGLAQHRAEQAVRPRQRADPLPLLVADADGVELGEPALLVGDARARRTARRSARTPTRPPSAARPGPIAAGSPRARRETAPRARRVA